MTLNIVVVDDETPICDWLLYCIQNSSENYTVSSASNGEEALLLIKEKKPDLVFTDICMPGMNGLELMREVIKFYPFTRFIILTNYAEFSYAKEAISLGAKDYLLKSELRITDIQEILEKTYKLKKELLSNKRLEVLSSGNIDLYNFYNNIERNGFADDFWKQQGMKEDVPFQVLCYQGNSSLYDSEYINFTKEISSLYECKISFLSIAKGSKHKYLILQVNNRIQMISGKAAEYIKKKENVGISSVITERDEMIRGIRESSKALNLSFFKNKPDAFYYAKEENNISLDREKLHSEKKEILYDILQCRFVEAELRLMKCYDKIKKTGPEDSKWAIDFIKRIVFAIEDIYYQKYGCETKEVEIVLSGCQCMQHCKQIIGSMKNHYYGKHSKSIMDALEYIHMHYTESISMSEVARYVYRAPEYFSRKFKEEVGENFNTYVTLYRLNCAKELLKYSNLNVSEIAEQVGFSTPGYFSRLYKRYNGITPDQERML